MIMWVIFCMNEFLYDFYVSSQHKILFTLYITHLFNLCMQYLYRPTLNLNTLIVYHVSINFYKSSLQVLLVTDFIFVV